MIANNHYWAVAGDDTLLWSTKAGAYVPATDEGFVAWLEAGNVPTQIASEEDLAGVISDFRANAYHREADPIMCKMLRGEATKEEWLTKVNEIKTRWPKPAGSN